MATGQKTWVIPGGRIPLLSSGIEPANTSRDELCILNTNESDASIQLVIYYEHQPPVGPYVISVQAQRMRVIRFNDLVDPAPILLDMNYAVVINSDIPIVVQFTRVDSSSGSPATTITMAYPNK